jgi:uncharacterized protein (TIGR02996 family)
VYLDGERLTFVPGYWLMSANCNPTLTGGLPLHPILWLTNEQARGMPLTRAHDAQALANMVRFWLTASPLVTHGESFMHTLMNLVLGQYLFHYDGPLHEAIDAGLGGSLERCMELLELADVSTTDADHATRTRLIAEIVAHPDDDGPRFVLADHLLERGDPRGELIQLQCRGQPVDELLAAHGTRWSAHLVSEVREAFFDRGFVALVRGVDREGLERRRDALLAFGPLPRIE